MKGDKFREIRVKLGLYPHEFAVELGYRGGKRSNEGLIRAYEENRKQIPLTVASLAWLLEQWFENFGDLPEWPIWDGYEIAVGPPLNYEDERTAKLLAAKKEEAHED